MWDSVMSHRHLLECVVSVLVCCLFFIFITCDRLLQISDNRIDWLRESRVLIKQSSDWNKHREDDYRYWSESDKKSIIETSSTLAVNISSLQNLPTEETICDISVFLNNINSSSPLDLVITFANHAYVKQGLISNLVCSFNRLSLSAFVIIVTDEDAYKETIQLGYESHVHWCPSYWKGTSKGVLRQSYVSTDEYLFFIRKRTAYVGTLLSHDSIQKSTLKHITLTDGDTVWTHNANNIARSLGGESNCDAYVVNDADEGSSVDHHNRIEPVGGFIIYNIKKKDNLNKLITLFRLWISIMDCLGSREQPALHGALLLLNVSFSRPWTATSVTPDKLLFCVLPAYHFPTSAHLSMRSKNELKPTYKDSRYLTEFGYTDPKLVSSSVVVAHANVKIKFGKVSWLSQFRMFYWDLLQAKCRSSGELVVLKPHPSLPNHPNYDSSNPSSVVTAADQHIGWVKPSSLAPWSRDFVKYLNARAAPGSNWLSCEASFTQIT